MEQPRHLISDQYDSLRTTNLEIYKAHLLAQFPEEGPDALTPERRQQVDTLFKRQWFVNTRMGLQLEVIGLHIPEDDARGIASDPHSHDGFVDWLAGRPDVIGGVPVTRLVALPRANYTLIPTWEQRIDRGEEHERRTGERYLYNTYEAVCGRHGTLPGVKSLIAVRETSESEPTHVIVRVGNRFATGNETVFDGTGGFNEGGELKENVIREIREEMGVEDLCIDEIIDLGNVFTDPGITPNRPSIHLAFITREEADRLPSEPINLDVRELGATALVVPLAQLSELAAHMSDGIMSAVLLRCLTSRNTNEASRRAFLQAMVTGGLGGVATSTIFANRA